MSSFDPYSEWLGISAEEQPPNYYRLLGLPLFETDIKKIEGAAQERLGQLRDYRLSKAKDVAKKLIDEVIQARKCLRNPGKKEDYDQQLSIELDQPLPTDTIAEEQQHIASSTDAIKTDAVREIEPDPVHLDSADISPTKSEPSSTALDPEEAEALPDAVPVTDNFVTTIFEKSPLPPKALALVAAAAVGVVCIFLLGSFLWSYETPTQKVVAVLAQAEGARSEGDHARARALCIDAMKIEGALNHRSIEKLLRKIETESAAQWQQLTEPAQPSRRAITQQNEPAKKTVSPDLRAEAAKQFIDRSARVKEQQTGSASSVTKEESHPEVANPSRLPLYAELAETPRKLDRLSVAHPDEIGKWQYIIDVRAQDAKYVRRVHLLFDDAAAVTNQLASPLTIDQESGTHTQKWDRSATHRFVDSSHNRCFGSTSRNGNWVTHGNSLNGNGIVNHWHRIEEYATLPSAMTRPYFKVGRLIDPDRDGTMDGFWWRSNASSTGTGVDGLVLTLRIVHPHPPADDGFTFEANSMNRAGRFRTTRHTLRGPARPPGTSALLARSHLTVTRSPAVSDKVPRDSATHGPPERELASEGASVTAVQAPSFTPHTINTDATNAISVYAADLDSDGDHDVLSASYGDNKIAWHENRGGGHFTSHTVTADAKGAEWVHAADLDNDGDSDVLSASYHDNKIAWYENAGRINGTLRFRPHTITTAAKGTKSVYATDLDGDGDTDVLSASRTDNKITWYKNNGRGRFVAQPITTDAKGAVSVHAADLDGDGDNDVLSASFGDNKIAWYENDDSGRFTPHTISTDARGAQRVHATDLDGDGDNDVLSASWADGKIAWYENDRDGQEIELSSGGGSVKTSSSLVFTPHTITTSAKGAFCVTAADVDGDGDTDVLSASTENNKINWYENRGNKEFTQRTVDANVNGATGVYAADLDGDGDIDVLSASYKDNKISWHENTMARPTLAAQETTAPTSKVASRRTAEATGQAAAENQSPAFTPENARAYLTDKGFVQIAESWSLQAEEPLQTSVENLQGRMKQRRDIYANLRKYKDVKKRGNTLANDLQFRLQGLGAGDDDVRSIVDGTRRVANLRANWVLKLSASQKTALTRMEEQLAAIRGALKTSRSTFDKFDKECREEMRLVRQSYDRYKMQTQALTKLDISELHRAAAATGLQLNSTPKINVKAIPDLLAQAEKICDRIESS